MGRKKNANVINGWLNIDKPQGITSNQVIGRLKRLFNPSKIGHTGTLDPMATGVLPIAFGEATKLISHVMDDKKEYIFEVKWAVATDSYDQEGNVVATCEHIPTREDVLGVLDNFKGTIKQVPPKYSAVKIDGQRAYDLARKNVDFEIKSKDVKLYNIDILPKATVGDMAFKVLVGKGFYIRSLAVDIAKACNSLAHVVLLQRSASRNFSLSNAISLDFLESLVYKDRLKEILPIEEVLDDISDYPLSQEQALDISYGRKLDCTDDCYIDEGQIFYSHYQGKLLAIMTREGNHLVIIRKFNL